MAGRTSSISNHNGVLVMITKCSSSSYSIPPDRFARNTDILPRFSITKPSWVVRTESNVWKEERKKPHPPCLKCGGSGRVDCHHCQGKGRSNCVHLAMLPKGEWPKCIPLALDMEKRAWVHKIAHGASMIFWLYIRLMFFCNLFFRCRTCGGSGLGYCGRCLGSGEYRDIMGFHFMKKIPNTP